MNKNHIYLVATILLVLFLVVFGVSQSCSLGYNRIPVLEVTEVGELFVPIDQNVESLSLRYPIERFTCQLQIGGTIVCAANKKSIEHGWVCLKGGKTLNSITISG